MQNNVQKICFSNLLIRNKKYCGHLLRAEHSIAKCFIVFIENHVAGSLLYFDGWELMQVGKQLPDLCREERNVIAESLKKIVEDFQPFTQKTFTND